MGATRFGLEKKYIARINGPCVRLILLASTPDILNIVVQHLKNNHKCKCYFHKYYFIMNSYILFVIIIMIYLGNDFALEALQFKLQKSVQSFAISKYDSVQRFLMSVFKN